MTVQPHVHPWCTVFLLLKQLELNSQDSHAGTHQGSLLQTPQQLPGSKDTLTGSKVILRFNIYQDTKIH